MSVIAQRVLKKLPVAIEILVGVSYNLQLLTLGLLLIKQIVKQSASFVHVVCDVTLDYESVQSWFLFEV